MNNSKIKLFLALALVVTASGCTDTTESSDVSVSQTEGLVIDQFAAFPTPVPDQTQVQIDLVMVNKGEAEAENVEWSIENIPFEGSRNWEKEGGFEQQDLRIAPANPETGQQAGRRSLHPTVTSPDLSQGLSIPYTMNMNVTYDYSTTGVTEVTLMSRSRYQENGGSKSSVTLDNTGGPVQLQTNTRNPIVYYSTGGSTNVQNSRFCVTATNEGTGDLVGEEVDVTVETSGTLQVSSSRDSGYDTTSSGTIEFIGGRSSSQDCFYLEAPSSVSGQLTLPITVKADYRYQIEDATTVTVEGRGFSDSDSSDTSSTEGDLTGNDYVWTGSSDDGEPTGTVWRTATEGDNPPAPNGDIDAVCSWLIENNENEGQCEQR